MTEAQRIRRSLRQAGLTSSAIDAVWPGWWSEDAEGSLSATAELRYSLARRLGFSPRSLFEDEPTFTWSDDTRFKNLGTATAHDAAILASFSVAVGRAAVGSTEASGPSLRGTSAHVLRSQLLLSQTWVDLLGLLSLCWGVGVPVLYLEVFPLPSKHMHAATTRIDSRDAILLGRSSSYPAQVAYYLAHEIGHIALGHSAGSAALVDVDDPLQVADRDDDEVAADRFALELLTGNPDPQIEWTDEDFSGAQLAEVALRQGPPLGIDPGVLALCVGHRSGRWPQTFRALSILQDGQQLDLPSQINALARSQIDWSALTADAAEYLDAVLGGAGAQ